MLLLQCSQEITAPSNDAPYIQAFPALVSRIGEEFPIVSLDQFVEDESPDSMISWSLTNGLHVSGNIENRVLHLAPDDPSWTGADVIALRATDPEGLTSQASVVCHVVDPSQWEHRNADGTMTIVWPLEYASKATVRFGLIPTQLHTESRSMLPPDTLCQVRLLGITPNQIIYYQAVNYDLAGSEIFASPVDSFVTFQVQPSDVFRVTMIDVRQGDSFLLVSPSGIVTVIDGGYGTYEPSFGGPWSGDGYPFALEYLQAESIDHVDHMVETHHDMDHWGGLRDIQNAMPVYHYYSPDEPDSIVIGQSWDLGDTLLVAHVLSLDYPPDVPHEGDNNRSIVLRFQIGDVSFLFTGDSEREVELWEAATYGADLQSAILKVAHHGSASSSDPAFLALVQPQIALISCGAGNPYGHPHEETMESLDAVHAEIYRTDLEGDVTFRTDGRATLEIAR